MLKIGWIYGNCKCFKSKKLTTEDRLMNLYDIGCDRFDTELGVERILKNLRDVRIYV